MSATIYYRTTSLQNAHSCRLNKRFPRCLRRPLCPRAIDTRSNTSQSIINDYHRYTIPLYSRQNMVLVNGKGAYVQDLDGKQYLDFSGGVAVNALGHSEERVIEAITAQAPKIVHTSNLFHTEPAIALAKRLVHHSFADKVFLCNSGTEANEAAIKFARKWAAVKHGFDPYNMDQTGPAELVSFTCAFHGRTMGALALTPKDKFQAPFMPMLPGHQLAVYNDLPSAERVIKSGKTCAVFVEPVQGEGGVHCASTEFLQGLRSLCDVNGCLLVFDEVQSGLGRSGKLWAHEHHDVQPDVMTLAKPLAGGLPIGAVLVTDAVAETLQAGDHGSTFAGNALICNVANTVFDIVSDEAFLADVQQNALYFRKQLDEALSACARVKEIRHCGMLFGIECDGLVSDIVKSALEMGLIVITAGEGNVIRLAPPLNVTRSEVDTCVDNQVRSSSIFRQLDSTTEARCAGIILSPEKTQTPFSLELCTVTDTGLKDNILKDVTYKIGVVVSGEIQLKTKKEEIYSLRSGDMFVYEPDTCLDISTSLSTASTKLCVFLRFSFSGTSPLAKREEEIVVRKLDQVPVFQLPNQTNRFALSLDPFGEGFPITMGIEMFEPGHKTPPHVHTHAHEIFFLLSGTGSAFCNSERREVGSGDTIVIPPKSVHGVDNDSTKRLYSLELMVPNQLFAEFIRSGTEVGTSTDEDMTAIAAGPWE